MKNMNEEHEEQERGTHMELSQILEKVWFDPQSLSVLVETCVNSRVLNGGKREMVGLVWEADSGVCANLSLTNV